MSKAKKGSKATPEAVSWDEGLINAAVQEDDWRPYLVFACPNSPHDEPHIEALANAVSSGVRRRFTIIDRENMLQSALEDIKMAQSAAASGGGGKKSKAVAVPATEKPMFIEVCEQVVDVMKSGGPVPSSLLAKMLKYKVLRHKAAHRAAVAQKEAEEAAKKQAAEKGAEGKGGKGGKGGGKASKAGKKGKDTPAMDATLDIPLPEIPPTSMRKRGEEDLDSKYIDDEPDDGPTCYIIMTGFNSLDLLKQMSPVGLTAHVLMNVTGGSVPPIDPQTNEDEEVDEEKRREEEQHELNLIQFWQNLGQCVQTSKEGHMLRDMAQIEVTLTQPLVPDSSEKESYGQTLFNAVAHSIYQVLIQSTQYQHYIHYLDLRPLSLPVPLCGAKGSSFVTDTNSLSPLTAQSSMAVEIVEPLKVDLRIYNNLLNSVPQNAVTIPLMLHCMAEQVCATLSADDANPPPSQQDLHPDVLSQIISTIAGLCIPTSIKRSLLPDQEVTGYTDSNANNVTVSIEHWDEIKLLSHCLPGSKLLNVTRSQIDTNSRALLGAILNAPSFDTDELNSHQALLHAIEHFCTSAEVSTQLLNHALLVLSLERVVLPNASSFPELSYNTTPLQFDSPLNISIKEKISPDSASVALVPYTNGQDNVSNLKSVGERVDCQYELDLPLPNSSLDQHTVCEPLSKGSLLQLLQTLQSTHPYLSVYNHRLSQSTLVVAHSGFDGRPLHTYTWQSLAHSQVGFNNYLQYIAHEFGEEIDRAVEEDEERREVFEDEQQRLIEERKELEQQEEDKTKEEQEEPKVSAKGGKKSVAKKPPSGKKSKLDTECTTPEPTNDATPIEDSLPEFEERKLYEAYDVGDRVLLNKGSVSVQFTSDGTQIYTEKTEGLESETTIIVSAIGNGHKVSCNMIKREANREEKRSDERENDRGDESKIDDSSNEEREEKSVVVVAGIPQPPPGIDFSSLTAHLRESLHISVSHFGPNGNGELPFEPPKPDILLESATCPDSSADSRPQSRQTPQKMSKKQMEQQQQLLEQQRQLEEQKKKERADAKEKYDARYSALLRQNKYQQLFASTPYGLHIHCQVSVDLNADPTITDGRDGSVIVKQSYPLPSHNTETSLAIVAYNEVERYCLPDGSVLRFMKDGSIVILSPDGYVYQTATKSLNDLYHQHMQDQGSGEAVQGEVGQAAADSQIQNTFSETKVTFADQLNKIPMEDSQKKDISKIVWVVTSPAGNRYLWKHQAPHNIDSGESGEVPPEGNDDSGIPGPKTLPQVSIVPLPSAQVFATTDPVTKEVLINREDNVTMLSRPDGSFVTEHADGTRITTAVHRNDPSTPLEVMAECPGFARVTHTKSRQCLVHFPDGSKVVASSAGHYTVEKKDEFQLEVKPGGESQCSLQPAEPNAYSFVMDHTGVNNLLVARSKASKIEFSVNQEGVPTVSHEGTIPPHPAFLPRYFVVPSNGNPYQILSQKEMDSFLAAVECQPNTTIVKGEPVPGFEGTTVAVMEALQSKNPAIMPYKNGSIIPKNLSLNPTQNNQTNLSRGKRQFGVGVGRALSIQASTKKEIMQKVEVPTALKCRQFVSLDLKDSLRNQICSGLAGYIDCRQQQQSTADGLLPVDLRDASEKEAANSLKSEWLTKMSEEILGQALQDIQHQSTLKVDSKVDLQDSDMHNTKALSGIKQDLQQAMQHQQALRNRTVPLYFESDDGQQFLRSQSPDMNELALQLAQPKAQCDATSEDSSTPSTLQSASIVLQPTTADSPDVGEIDAVSLSSMSKIRPAHPTPDHAQGMHTPTNVRPTNPTPFHAANRAQHSPAPSIISQPETFKAAQTLNSTMDKDTSALGYDSTAERSVSFSLPQGRLSRQAVGKSPTPVTQTELVRSKPLRGMIRSKPNTKFGEIEDTVRRKVHTSSTMTGGMVRGFEVQPQSLDFGTIREGCTYVHTLTLKNVGIDSCRFKIKQPPPSTGIKVIYTPGPVAAGMSRQCEVEIFAIAVGVVGRNGTGYVNHDLEVISEANILQIPIRASVLTSSACEGQNDFSHQPSAVGVRQVNRVTSREDFTRPSRVQD